MGQIEEQNITRRKGKLQEDHLMLTRKLNQNKATLVSCFQEKNGNVLKLKVNSEGTLSERVVIDYGYEEDHA